MNKSSQNKEVQLPATLVKNFKAHIAVVDYAEYKGNDAFADEPWKSRLIAFMMACHDDLLKPKILFDTLDKFVAMGKSDEQV